MLELLLIKIIILNNILILWLHFKIMMIEIIQKAHFNLKMQAAPRKEGRNVNNIVALVNFF